MGRGQYFQVDQSGGAVAIATPFDARLAELSAKLHQAACTMWFRGGAGGEAPKAGGHRQAARGHIRGVPDPPRDLYCLGGGAISFLGDKELVADVASGRGDLKSVVPEALPAPLQAMTPEEQKAAIGQTLEQGKELQGKVRDLAEQRAGYLKRKVEEDAGAGDSVDAKIYRTVRAQAVAAGLSYASEGPAY